MTSKKVSWGKEDKVVEANQSISTSVTSITSQNNTAPYSNAGYRPEKDLKKNPQVIIKELTLQRDLLQAALDRASIGLVSFNPQGNVLVCNQIFTDIVQIDNFYEKKIDYHFITQWLFTHLKNAREVIEILTRPVKEYSQIISLIYEMKDGRFLRCTSNPIIKDGWIEAIIWSIEDITSLILSEQRAQYKAQHDSLTALPNRETFFQELATKVAMAHKRKNNLAVLFIDIDHFKSVNDNYGHNVGDKVLIETCERIRQSLRIPDLLARMSGDEFVIILEDVENQESVRTVVERIHQQFAKPFIVSELEIMSTVSIGAALLEAGQSANSLINNADKAMYSAKRQGRNTFCFYPLDMKA